MYMYMYMSSLYMIDLMVQMQKKMFAWSGRLVNVTPLPHPILASSLPGLCLVHVTTLPHPILASSLPGLGAWSM